MSLPKLPDKVVSALEVREKASALNFDARKTANDLTQHLKILKSSFELRKQLELFGDTYSFYLDRLAASIEDLEILTYDCLTTYDDLRKEYARTLNYEDINRCELESVFEIMNKALFS